MNEQQPEAIRIAEHLESCALTFYDKPAAAELRRQHARILELEQNDARYRWLEKGLPFTVILDASKPNGACTIYGPNPEKGYKEGLARAIDAKLLACPPPQEQR